MSVKAIILSAGSGKRIGQDMPKQYIPLSGTPILLHTLIRFQESEIVDDIILVVAKGYTEWVKDHILAGKGLKKISAVIEGGIKRQDSSASGLQHIRDITDDNDIIIVHDGARPFIDQSKIKDCVYEARKTGACILGIQITETLKTVETEADGGTIKATCPFRGLWIAQTPQAFRASLLKQAHNKAREEGFYGTDEASLVERLPFSVKIIPGSLWNIKITYQKDLKMAEEILKMRYGA